jgi:phosphoglycerol transferase MdoB-like AlkP superfamily enzyme
MKNMLRFWIYTFVRKEKEKFDMLDGVYSVFFSSMIVGIALIIKDFMSGQETNVVYPLFAVLFLSIIAVSVAGFFVGIVRFLSKSMGGKGNFEKDWCAVAPYLGSFIFVFCLIFTQLVHIYYSNLYGLPNIGILSFLRGVLFGGVFAVLFICFSVFLSQCSEQLQKVEKLSAYNSGKALGAGFGLMLLILFCVMGIIGARTI